jgi:hypothetical protein
MAFGFGPTPWAQLPNGANIWGGDAPPTGAGSNAGIQAGDYLFGTGSPSGGAIWQCTSTTATASVWRQLSSDQSSFKTVSADYTLDPVLDNGIVLLTNNTVTLPAASAVAVGKSYTVTRVGAANGALAGHINAGTTSAAFGSDGASITVRSNGTTWYATSVSGTVTIT